MRRSWARRKPNWRAVRVQANPAKRFGNIEEFGAACAFLCSAHAGFITGQNLLMDGGAFPGTSLRKFFPGTPWVRQLYQATGTSVLNSSSCTTRALPRRGAGGS